MSTTIKDIALVAGVSYSTVSKALNNSPLVKKDTKDKIMAIAKEMGYEPNFAAQRLVSKKTKMVGLIWPTIERVVLATLVTKISDEIRRTSYSMILSVDPIEISLETFRKFQVDGIILFEEDVDLKIDTHPIPLLTYGVSKKDGSPYPVIDANHEQAMHDAIQYLIELGHRRIAYIGDMSPKDPMQIEKYNGFLQAMKKNNLPVENHHLVNTGGLDWYDGYSAVKKLLAHPPLPTAIVGGSYDISGGIIRGLKENQIDIPTDISIISYDNIPQMANLEIPLTSIGVPVDQLAKEIVHTVIQLIEEQNLDPSGKKLQPILTERASCAPPPSLN
ncbi:LacI family transcriptional regulator [Lederbergia sp. NSJ-179]|uniref:LacI family DNA-binding transcriptional regulator n=1 Tax=Lederbergia sp. NSJ-179 TaxID=2931402 RepID=UPI001FD59000|nr:LacI family DNA-binding transcriptional regulator [Lederbergia sp. NSJ-179]MCJ7840712.1 LacI family transcriptional regulator [Lederbergia sp. NSJ-179]